jgi:hypothetical protein
MGLLEIVLCRPNGMHNVCNWEGLQEINGSKISGDICHHLSVKNVTLD